MQTNTSKFDGKPVGVTVVAKRPKTRGRMPYLPVLASAALMGVFAVAMYCLFGTPVAATEGINLTFVGPLFTSLFDAITSVFPSFGTFIDEGFPLLIKVIVYVAIIGVIGLFLYFFREVIMKIVHMIGLGGEK